MIRTYLQKPVSWKKAVPTLLIAALISTLILSQIYAAVPNSGPYYLDIPFGTSSYYMGKFANGSTYMVNGDNWKCTESSTDPSTIFNYCEGNLSSGGKIFIKRGNYTLSSSFSILNDNICVVGEGPGTILSGAISESYIHIGNGSIALTGISISNLQINGTEQTGLFTSHGIYFHGGNGYEITYSSVRECSISDVINNGVTLSYTEFSSVEHNFIRGSDMGVNLGSYSDNNTLLGNTCIENMIGIYLNDLGHFNTVVGNICNENTEAGIKLYDSDNNVIAGNTCNGNPYGIDLMDSNMNNAITGNICTGNSIYGITLSEVCYGNTVAGNICSENTESGMMFWTSDQNAITGNTCNQNGKHGIYLTSSDNNVIAGNTCIENDIGNTGSYDGIYLSGSDQNLVTGNLCSLNDRYGINVGTSSCDHNSVENNELMGNTLEGVNDDGTDTTIKNNHGFVTENSGAFSGSNEDYFSHGLAGAPTSVSLTCMNGTYDSVPVVVNCNYANTNSTHSQISLHWSNGTAITTDLLISYTVKYDPTL